MILKVELLDAAISQLRTPDTKVILLDAAGSRFNQKKATELSHESHLIFICGHYEGVDHRVHEHLADEVISIGDYVLSGGEIPTMVIVDTITRLLPGALGNPDSLTSESHNEDATEYPQYTRPEVYKDWKVPEVLLSGDHKKIEAWKLEHLRK
jgi:tRNA (guanine37-N1)-methyltransferase